VNGGRKSKNYLRVTTVRRSREEGNIRQEKRKFKTTTVEARMLQVNRDVESFGTICTVVS